MHCLPPISLGRTRIALPIRSDSLIELAVALAQDEDRKILLLNSAFAKEDSLLLFALHEYYESKREPAANPEELTRWAGMNLLDCLSGSSQNGEVTLQCSATDEHKSDATPINNKKLRRHLFKRAKAWLPDLKSKKIRSWINKVCEQFNPQDVARVEEPEAVTAIDMFKVVADLVKHEDEFQDRLHREKLLSMKQLAYGASHEINNPLANIATRAETLLAGEGNPERRRKIAVIHQQAIRAHEMISDLMLFAHPPVAKPVSLDPADLAKEVVSEFRAETRRYQIKIDVRRYPNVPQIEADKTQLGVAIRALVQNSIDSIKSCLNEKDSGLIQVQIWRKSEDRVAITIVDDGVGVDSAQTRHLFDPFYSGREAGRGLGFGLSKSWTIIEKLHGGQLYLRPTEEGAKFECVIPIKAVSPIRISVEQAGREDAA